MGRRLAYSVCLDGEDGQPVVLTPDEDVPDWAVGKIGDHAFANDDDAEQADPPRAKRTSRSSG